MGSKHLLIWVECSLQGIFLKQSPGFAFYFKCSKQWINMTINTSDTEKWVGSV